jgi:5-methylcytosine-specific restriction endonuclease McrA
MPYMTNGKRDYKKQAKYDSKLSVKKDRAARNKARREMEREGKVHKGDGKEVDHKKPLSKGGSKSRSNLRVRSASSNRSFARTKNGSMK